MKIYPLPCLLQALLIVLVLCHPACRTKQIAAKKSKSSVRVHDDVHFDSQQLTALVGRRFTHITDSSKQLYRVTIVPMDTFSLSFTDGFKGRASLIEYIGASEQQKVLTDNLVFASKSQSEIQLDSERKSSNVELSKSKHVKKNSVTLFAVLILVGLLLLNFWLLGKRGRLSSRSY